ncbi:MAG: peptide synthase [Deltaproteobacteria bacterium CG_4_10_14_3_um_filter_60_8]|nr:MAG: peptide synthase [Desulfobacterales bacterium CG2_30_60_27]PIY21371.1 MAG: peptide synthase [Deltaproteobacteria bacterium CG_4_10_14_3_um_filter_60_8]
MDSHNIGHTLTRIAHSQPERIGLICNKHGQYKQWTFSELESIVQSFCHDLHRRGISKGTRVMLMVQPGLEFIGLAFALFRLGAVVILIDPGMGFRNLFGCIGSARPEVFIGTPKAILFKRLFASHFTTVKQTIIIHPWSGLGRRASAALRQTPATGPDDLAAIIFTTGSTGPPKGVCYTHAIFQAQLDFIHDYYGIGPTDIDQPAFPLFALFSIGLGAAVVIPEMNPARPAKVNPAKFIRTIKQFNVTYSFGSPAIWNRVSRYCLDHGLMLPSLRKVLMAGAPVTGDLLARVKAMLPEEAEIHTPYGATESLPTTDITGHEILTRTWPLTRQGKGTCVGRPLPGNRVRIIAIDDGPITAWDDHLLLPTREIGEIVVQGLAVTKAYDHNEPENRLAKIPDQGAFWHRMGDVGYLDLDGRLWVCGRKAHRVITSQGTLFPLPCEAICNTLPGILRSALVGVGTPPDQTPVLIVELLDKGQNQARLLGDLKEMAARQPLLSNIRHFLIHDEFPTDIRHNVKIFREKLAVWAATRVDRKGEK